MCDPITIAGAALLAGSTVANQVASNRVQRARNDAMAAERTRQNALDQEAQALNTRSQDRYQDFDGQQHDKASELGQYFTDQQIEQGNANQSAVAEQTIPQSGSNVVVAEEAKQRGQARAYADQQGNALGELRSFGDLIGEIGRSQARDASEIGQIGGFKRGSSNVLPFELEAANSAGAGAQLFGDILGLGGSLAVGKGLSGGDKLSKFPVAPGGAFPAAPSGVFGDLIGIKPAAANAYSIFGAK